MSRRLALSGVVVVVAYVASAALSGHLSPLARRPILDGFVPPTAYRWVDPPPELESTNVPPSAEIIEVAMDARGNKTAVPTTEDAQVTLILPRGVFASAPGQRSVEIEVEPLAPSAVSQPEPPSVVYGNVYRIEASYRPSGDPAPLVGEARVVLVYPAVANDHGGHEVLVSAGGRTWTGADTNDLPSIQQVDAAIRSLGYLTVGGRPPSPTASAGPGLGGSSNAATLAIVAGLVVLVIGTAIVLRPSRPRTGAARGSRPSRSRSSRRD